jgi:hypothetical protein
MKYGIGLMFYLGDSLKDFSIGSFPCIIEFKNGTKRNIV